MEQAGYNSVIKISGTAVSIVGEATTSVAGDLVYQITDATKQVLDRVATIRVQKKGSNDAAEAGTTTTNIKMTTHGLVAGDLICNTTRSNAYRLVTVRVDADNVTVAAVTGQTTGDTIEVYKTEATTAYSLNKLNGSVTYPTNTSRVIKISGSYLPMSTAAYANNFSVNDGCEIVSADIFGTEYKNRVAGLKFASGTLNQIDITDSTYKTALLAGLPIVIEDRTLSTDEPSRHWAILDSSKLESAVEGLTNEAVSWQSTDEWIRLGS